jgi:NitT/TauT family transport system substrate-binding protein
MKRVAIKRLSLLLIAFILFSTVLTGCQNSGASAKKLPKIRIGIITAGAVRPALEIAAYELGYYKQEGVNVQFVNIDSLQSALAAIATNKLDVLPYAIVPSLAAIGQGADDVIIGGTASEGSSLCKGKNDLNVDFRNLKNWIGKKIGYSKTDTTIILLQNYLKSKGLDLSKVDWVSIDDENSRLEALKKGTIDAGFLTQERLWVAEKAGLKEAFQLAEYLPNYICCRQTASLTRVKKNRKAYVALLRAQIRAERDYKIHTSKVYTAVAKYIGQSKTYVKNYIATPNTINTGGLVQFRNPVSPDPMYNKVKQLYQVSEQAGVFKQAKGVDLKKHVDITLFQDAINQLIKKNSKDATYKKIKQLFLAGSSEYAKDK